VRIVIRVLAAVWLLSGCVTNRPDEDSTGAGHRDPHTGLCNDGTAPPCSPPRD
jgi:hypothetical protein